MKIVIAGAGTVGGAIAAQLAGEGHDITLIDRDADTIAALSGKLDVICVEGSASVPSVLEEAGVPGADLLIAATEYDEVNMICGIAARRLGAKHVIARVRDPQYREDAEFFCETLGLGMLFNPEFECAMEISRVLRFPGATRVDAFSKGTIEIAEHRVKKGETLDGLALKDLRSRLHARVLVSLVEREDEAFIPNGDFVIREGDRLSVSGGAGELKKFFTWAGAYAKPVKRAFLSGGNRTAVYLAKALTEAGIGVLILEKDPERCRQLCGIVPEAVVVCADATQSSVLEEEGFGPEDAFVALTPYDGDNIITAAYAKSLGAAKSVARIDREDLLKILPASETDGAILTRDASVSKVTAYVRALSNSMESGSIETMYYLAGGRAEALEFIVGKDVWFAGRQLRDLRFAKGTLVAAVIRGRNFLIPEGETHLLPGDHAVIVCPSGQVKRIEDAVIHP